MLSCYECQKTADSAARAHLSACTGDHGAVIHSDTSACVSSSYTDSPLRKWADTLSTADSGQGEMRPGTSPFLTQGKTPALNRTVTPLPGDFHRHDQNTTTAAECTLHRPSGSDEVKDGLRANQGQGHMPGVHASFIYFKIPEMYEKAKCTIPLGHAFGCFLNVTPLSPEVRAASGELVQPAALQRRTRELCWMRRSSSSQSS